MTRERENFVKFGASFLIFLIVFAFSVFLNTFGFLKLDLVLIFLLVLASFARSIEVLFFGLLSVFLMNWQIGLSWEAILFLVLPLGVSVWHRFLRGKPFLQNAIINFLGVIIFYAVSVGSRIFSNLGIFSELIFGDLVFGCVMFMVFRNFSNQN